MGERVKAAMWAASVAVIAASAAYVGVEYLRGHDKRLEDKQAARSRAISERRAAEAIQAEQDAKPLGRRFEVSGGGELLQIRVPRNGMAGREYRHCVLYRHLQAASLWCEALSVPDLGDDARDYGEPPTPIRQ